MRKLINLFTSVKSKKVGIDKFQKSRVTNLKKITGGGEEYAEDVEFDFNLIAY